MIISLEKFWAGRNVRYKADLTDEIVQNALITVERVNWLLDRFYRETGILLDECASGWRPPVVNEGTSNAAKLSRHLTAEAMDVRDTPARDFARWCLRNPQALEDCGLWMEDPRHTWRKAEGGRPWVHLQIRPPRSGLRIYLASNAPATAPLLPEQLEAAA